MNQPVSHCVNCGGVPAKLDEKYKLNCCSACQIYELEEEDSFVIMGRRKDNTAPPKELTRWWKEKPKS